MLTPRLCGLRFQSHQLNWRSIKGISRPLLTLVLGCFPYSDPWIVHERQLGDPSSYLFQEFV